ncbi:MAG: DUF4102 domain-containing protein [Gammaproteobacteria bacterium]|nr:MAG: DUF4102 domain-containing protein [Gammaproteobacteria bacterium]
MTLKDLTIRAAKPREKAYKLSDEKGLYLHVFPNGSRYWRFKYYFAGKPRVLALGVYPELSLINAQSKLPQKTAFMLSQLNGVLNFPSKGKSECNRCQSIIAAGTTCFVIPKNGSGFTSQKRHCKDCFSDILNQSQKDLDKAKSLLAEDN